jgi:DNA-binding MarR family transcriptional regulator
MIHGVARDDKFPTKTRQVPQDSSVGERAGPWPGNLGPAPIDGIAVPGVERPFRSVGFTISTTGYAIARHFRELLAPLGVEPREFALLRTVATDEGVTQHVIAERMGVGPSRMVAFVDSLEQRRLLERRENPDDRRARALFLTPEGREVLGRAFAVAVEHEQRLCGELSDKEREQLLDLLARVGVQLGIPPGVHAGMGHSALADE